MPKSKTKPKYGYIVNNSIIQPNNEYSLTQEEYFLLYNFFVTYSVCKNQSFQKRNFTDYGWQTNNIKQQGKETDLGIMLKNHINFNISTFNGTVDLKDLFKKNDLIDGILPNYDNERAVITVSRENNKYLNLFHQIRNCLAHGKFMLKYSSNNEKMIVFQDDDSDNVTARMVIKLQTLIDLIFAIDKNRLIDVSIKLDKNAA